MTGNNEKSALVKRTDGKNAPTSRSKFDLSYHNFITPSYGKITPFMSLETVAGDKVPLRSTHKVRSYTLKSPLMSDVYMQKDFFAVPMECILPLNWQKIFSNPVVGDDVDATQCNCVFNPKTLLESLQNIPSYFSRGAGWLPAKGLNLLFLGEKLLSKGSLFSNFGINLWSCMFFNHGSMQDSPNDNFFLSVPTGSDFDDLIDAILGYLRHLTFNVGGINFSKNSITVSYIQLDSSLSSGYEVKSRVFSPKDSTDFDYFEDCMDFCREHYLTSFAISGLDEVGATVNGFSLSSNFTAVNLNIAPIIAYQICCAHYFTNDRIDYIYSAELYRQMMRGFLTNYSADTFEYNGVPMLFDELSGHWINKVCSLVTNITDDLPFYKAWYYLINLFNVNNSLRFSDYFTGSRLTPLAVGNTDVAVNTNQVSVIDVTRNIQIQRFLNLVNKTGRKFEEYVGKIFGTYVAPDYHNPIYLGKIRDKVVSYETENTGAAQQSNANSVTSTFSSTGNNFALEFDSDRPTIVIGVCSFDIPRVYSRTVSRDALHIDRFDYYNPFMQFIGDQDVNTLELGYSRGDREFSYQSRHAEYKTKYPICSGGFAKQNVLPSWQFVADLQYEPSDTLDANFIRSRRSELDKFYLALTGESPATRFHFICDFYNDLSSVSRPMVANPNIL